MNRLILPLLLLAACGDPDDDTNSGTNSTTEPSISLDSSAMPPLHLLQPEDLMQMIEDGGVQLVDSRMSNGFSTDHLPGALNLYSEDLRDTVDGIPGQAVKTKAATKAFQGAGLVADLPIVVYSQENDTSAGRLFWTLGLYGAKQDLYLLDGGLSAWVDAGGATESGASTASKSTWEGAATRDVSVDLDWMLENLDSSEVSFFDVRSPDEYSAGHIPGAINVDWVTNLNASGGFVSDSDIKANHNNPTTNTIIVYCQSGARASVSWALLATLYDDVRIYDGSWNEWGTDASTPKTTGSNP